MWEVLGDNGAVQNKQWQWRELLHHLDVQPEGEGNLHAQSESAVVQLWFSFGSAWCGLIVYGSV